MVRNEEDQSVAIELTNSGFAIVDAELVTWLNKRSWHANVNSRTGKVYACSNYSTAEGLGLIYMHRYIWGEIPDGFEIDHKDGDGLNNIRRNLRIATKSQNNSNRVVPQTEFGSGYRGVRVSRNGRFRANIRIDGIITGLGTYKDIEDAARAYDAAAREYYGEFAVLNFPDQE